MPDQFPKADVPASNNSTGPPTPPSGFHTPINTDTVVGHLGQVDKPAPSGQPAPNIHE